MTAAVAFATPREAPRWKRWLVYSPLARIVIFIVLAAATLWLLGLGAHALGYASKEAPPLARSGSILVRQLVPFLGAYLFLVVVVERRRPRELAWDKVLQGGALGVAWGVLFISSVVLVLWLAGSYEVTGTNAGVDWLTPLLLAGLGTAVAEEIIFRGVLFRITEEGLGTWAALAVSALFFGGVHIMNKGATVWSSVAIALEAGVLLGLAYNLTRSLPLVMGIHMGWNFAQGTIFGIPVSGHGDSGFLVSNRPGPEWLSGGDFGAEASVVAVLISLAASCAMLVVARRRGSIVVRSRRQRPIMDPAPTGSAAC